MKQTIVLVNECDTDELDKVNVKYMFSRVEIRFEKQDEFISQSFFSVSCLYKFVMYMTVHTHTHTHTQNQTKLDFIALEHLTN